MSSIPTWCILNPWRDPLCLAQAGLRWPRVWCPCGCMLVNWGIFECGIDVGRYGILPIWLEVGIVVILAWTWSGICEWGCGATWLLMGVVPVLPRETWAMPADKWPSVARLWSIIGLGLALSLSPLSYKKITIALNMWWPKKNKKSIFDIRCNAKLRTLNYIKYVINLFCSKNKGREDGHHSDNEIIEFRPSHQTDERM